MVKYSFILALNLAFNSLALDKLDTSFFEYDCDKPTIYSGEQTTCNFYLRSLESILEIEVARFPEFRGFWKENLVLRQGKIMMGFEPMPDPPWRRVTVGTYVLTPMVGAKNPSIQPMKLVVKVPPNPVTGGKTTEAEILSEQVRPLNVLPLPPVPSQLSKQFTGAVGEFTILVEKTNMPFKSDEPTQIRVSVHGRGNFQELNEVPYKFPKGIEILSQRAFADGSTTHAIKTFEWTLKINKQENFTLPPVPLVYFDPKQKNYTRKVTRPISFIYYPSQTIEPPLESAPLTWKSLNKDWKRHTSLWHSPYYWLPQLLILCAVMGYLIDRAIRAFNAQRKLSEQYRWNLRWSAIEKSYQEDSIPTFLGLADEMAFDLLVNHAKLNRKGLTRASAIRLASKTESEAFIDHVRSIFKTHQNHLFSHKKELTESPKQIWSRLNEIKFHKS